jgi:hypothetical protein
MNAVVSGDSYKPTCDYSDDYENAYDDEYWNFNLGDLLWNGYNRDYELYYIFPVYWKIKQQHKHILLFWININISYTSNHEVSYFDNRI